MTKEPIPPSQEELEQRLQDVKQIAAISRFEGLEPSPEYQALRDRYVMGEIDVRQFKAAVLRRWTKA